MSLFFLLLCSLFVLRACAADAVVPSLSSAALSAYSGTAALNLPADTAIIKYLPYNALIAFTTAADVTQLGALDAIVFTVSGDAMSIAEDSCTINSVSVTAAKATDSNGVTYTLPLSGSNANTNAWNIFCSTKFLTSDVVIPVQALAGVNVVLTATFNTPLVTNTWSEITGASITASKVDGGDVQYNDGGVTFTFNFNLAGPDIQAPVDITFRTNLLNLFYVNDAATVTCGGKTVTVVRVDNEDVFTLIAKDDVISAEISCTGLSLAENAPIAIVAKIAASDLVVSAFDGFIGPHIAHVIVSVTATPSVADTKAYLGAAIDMKIDMVLPPNAATGDYMFLTLASSENGGEVFEYPEGGNLICQTIDAAPVPLTGSLTVDSGLQVLRLPFTPAVYQVDSVSKYTIVCTLKYARVFTTQPVARAFVASAVDAAPTHIFTDSVSFPRSYLPYFHAETAVTKNIVPIQAMAPLVNGAEAVFGNSVSVGFTIESVRASAWNSNTAVVIKFTQGFVQDFSTCYKKGEPTTTYPSTPDPVAKTIRVRIGVPVDATTLSVECSGARNPTVNEASKMAAEAVPPRTDITAQLLFDVLIDDHDLLAAPVGKYGLPVKISSVDLTMKSTQKLVVNQVSPVTFKLTIFNNKPLVLIPDGNTMTVRYTPASAVFPFTEVSSCTNAAGEDISVSIMNSLAKPALQLGVQKSLLTVMEDMAWIDINCLATIDSSFNIAHWAPWYGHVRVFGDEVATEDEFNEYTIFYANEMYTGVKVLPEWASVVIVPLTITGLTARLPDDAIASLLPLVSSNTIAVIDAAEKTAAGDDSLVSSTSCFISSNTVTPVTVDVNGKPVLLTYMYHLNVACGVSSQSVGSAVATTLIESKDTLEKDYDDAITPWVAATTALRLANPFASEYANMCLNGGQDVSFGESETDCGGSSCAPCDTGKTCTSDSDCVQNMCDSETSKCVGVEKGPENGAAQATLVMSMVLVLLAAFM